MDGPAWIPKILNGCFTLPELGLKNVQRHRNEQVEIDLI